MTERRHQCMIYEGHPFDNLPKLIPPILHHLKEKYRCLLLGTSEMVSRMFTALSDAGLDAQRYVQKGALILSSDQNHLMNGEFDPTRMIKRVEEATLTALKDGYRGLWGSGDMTWEFGARQNLQKLLEYEIGLEKLFHRLTPLRGICQYHKDTLPLEAIGQGIYCHDTVYVNHTLQRINPYYLKPDTLLSLRPARETLLDIDRAFRELTSETA